MLGQLGIGCFTAASDAVCWPHIPSCSYLANTVGGLHLGTGAQSVWLYGQLGTGAAFSGL